MTGGKPRGWSGKNPLAEQVSLGKDCWTRWEEDDNPYTAIAAKCHQCQGGNLFNSEVWICDVARLQDRVAACRFGPGSRTPCPLHAWRPYVRCQEQAETAQLDDATTGP